MADNTIALQAKAPVLDPLATIQGLNAAQQGLLQNRLLGQQIQGKEALGRSITGAYDPASGKVDFDKALGTLAQDPQGAFAAPEFSAQVIARHLAETQANEAQLELGLKQSKAIADTTAPLLSAPPGTLTRDAVIGTMQDRLIKSGLFNDPSSVKLFQTFVQTLPNDDAGIRQLLQRAGESANMTTEGINLYRGSPTNVDVGGHIVNQSVSPLTGEMKVNGAIDKTFAPALVDVYNPVTKRMEKRTAADVAAASGGAAPAGGGNGRYPGAAGGAPAPFAAGPALGEAEAAQVGSQKSAESYNADLAEAKGFAQRLFGLERAAKTLATAQTGKGGQQIQDWKSLINTLNPGALSPEDKGKVLAFDEAKKYLTDYANRKGAAMGMGTDTAREMVHGANPSVDISNAAAGDMVKVIIGLERMQAAQIAAAQAAGISQRQGDYADWAATWARSVNPTAFMADQIPPAQRRKQIDAMSPGERAKYVAGLKAAIDAGMFTKADLAK